MAVAFISNGYDTTPEKPYGEGVWADSHPIIGQASYGVRSPLDWKVTAVAGQDRTVSIAAGRGFGHGVTDKTVANDTIQLDTVASGSRWDLIVCRRDWNPTAGVSSFQKVNGGATQVIPGGRLIAPGGIDDQPLALVQCTFGQTQPTSIIDLRTWSGDGGGVIANHDLVRSYMDAVGTVLNISGTNWIRRVGANDTPEWVKASEIGKIPLFGFSGGLAGSAVEGAQFLVQGGSLVNTTDNSGYARCTFPKPFPNGLLTVITTNGDSSIDRSRGSAFNFPVSGLPWDNGRKQDFVYSMTMPDGRNMPAALHRINWIALGW